MNSLKTLSTFLLLALVTASCGLIGENPGDSATDPTTTTEARSCVQVTSGTAPISTGARATDAISLSGEIFRCAGDVVVVADENFNEVIAAAQLAGALRGPVLLPHPQLPAEIGRLDPATVHILGDLEVLVPPGVEIVRHDISSALNAAAEALGTTRVVALPPASNTESVIETVRAITVGDRIALPSTEQPAPGQPSVDTAALVDGLADNTNPGLTWIVDVSDPTTLVLASALTHAVDASVITADLDDLFRYPAVGAALTGYPEKPFRVIGKAVTLDDWRLRTLVNGVELPGGGFELFPDHIKRRFVAFYGHPRSETLGAMGQVTPEGALDMMRNGGQLTGYSSARCLPSPCQGTVPAGLLEQYGADGAHVVPTFNYIASVAHPRCRSAITPLEAFQEGIGVAAANGGYVMLDIQPGAERFLAHAQALEDLLRFPHVGLALDPEWRCGWPDQTEFNRVGTASAAEINEVIHWLADLVNTHGLPQKMLLIQQFRLDMIQERDQLAQRPEIQVVIQMDGEGQGNLTVKDNTWRGVTGDTEDNHWMWGWKNFFVRDHPNGPYSPADTLNRQPVPVYISYQ